MNSEDPKNKDANNGRGHPHHDHNHEAENGHDHQKRHNCRHTHHHHTDGGAHHVHDHEHDHDHDHGHKHDHGHSHGFGHHHHHGLELDENSDNTTQVFRIKLILVLTVLYMLVEAVGGKIANSLALVSDATHMFTDAAALGLTLLSFYLSRLPASNRNSFGWHRAEILGAFLNGLFLFGIAAWIIFEAIARLQNPEPTSAVELIAISSGGFVLNVFFAFYLLKSSNENLAVKGAFLHVLGDALGSLGSIIAGVLIYYKQWYSADPIVSLIVAGLILLTSTQFMYETLHLMLQGVPRHLNLEQIQRSLGSIAGVQRVHRIHIWGLSSKRAILTAHVVSSENPDVIISKINSKLNSDFGIRDTTIQIDLPRTKS